MMELLSDHITHDWQGISEMQFTHAAAAVSSAFGDPNLIAYGRLEPVVRHERRSADGQALGGFQWRELRCQRRRAARQRRG
ncbi:MULTISPECIES: hypothetical protein [unclassified Streptomyces]|uniref:hypothetical protein n=1 Tax=unclassified Streptomyces TaxID=2593676 RepID=UPI001BB0CEF1|nr:MULTISPECIES: hypothetical protein [unclassified Streptomyces]MDH6455438.1 hypothetical protein [Streptomyces sp. SAI-119]MDH6494009.1 hypothetical protein [Streptomyces sp. SAI-149]QUC58783.1 hypothetical protein IOD14_19325 [Streptomyces sp. A2-16]